MCQVVVSRSTRRSPLSRQPVLTHQHRKHVIIGKSASLPLHDIVTDTATPHTDTRHARCHTVSSHSDSDSSSDDDDDDDDEDAVWLQDARPSVTEETDAIFIPGRLLGTSESFCVRSQSPSNERCGVLDVSGSQHAADDGDSQHGATLADDDTFDDVTSSSQTFVRETRIRRRPNIRRLRVIADHASD